MVLRPLSLALASGFAAIPFAAQTSQPIPFDAAQRDFAEAKALCQDDAGKLWGVSLCGPILFVDPDSRTLVANQPDAQGALTPQGGVNVGILPKSENFANTATDWSGTHWTEMMWPLPDELSRRDTLMLHELFHRIQDKLPFAPMRNASNAHLDTLDGRYTMLLEYRALARALNASDDNERRVAIADALLFRADRYHLFLRAAADEKTLEMNEGLAQYTGVRLGNPQPGEAQAAALRDLNNQAKVPSLVRSFAYATGPAYGLLLDRCRPDWRTALQSGQTLPELLQSALKVSLPADLEQATQQQAARYDGVALHATESEREKKRQARLTLYRAQFIDGPSLSIPLQKMSVQFDPRTLQPLDDLGTVYPEIRISDVWGILEASKGALVKGEWGSVVITAPTATTGSPIKGDGWTLELKPGWKLVPTTRKGDYLLQSTQ
ncbi:MAG: hypothetical protein WAK33_14725 [Silvibacterium sp.]